MFKRLIALTLLSAVFTVQASATSNENLDTIFRELNYSIKKTSLDEDQKSNVTAAKKVFDTKFKKLQAAGLTNTQMKNFAIAKLGETNSQLKDNIETNFTLAESGVISQKQFKESLITDLKEANPTGSSFNSTAGIVVAAVIILIVAVSVAAATGNLSVNTGYNDGYNAGYGCYDEYVCYDYYDDWGWYMYSDCWYETYCY